MSSLSSTIFLFHFFYGNLANETCQGKLPTSLSRKTNTSSVVVIKETSAKEKCATDKRSFSFVLFFYASKRENDSVSDTQKNAYYFLGRKGNFDKNEAKVPRLLKIDVFSELSPDFGHRLSFFINVTFKYFQYTFVIFVTYFFLF